MASLLLAHRPDRVTPKLRFPFLIQLYINHVLIIHVVLVKKHFTHDFRFCSSRGTVDDLRAGVGPGDRQAASRHFLCTSLCYLH